MHFHAPLIIDIAGTRLRKVDKKRLSHPLVGGLILFARNFTDRAQLTKLCRRIKKVRSDLLIAVDHEGGRVQRFKTDGFTHLPPMRALGQLWLQDGAAGEGSGAMRATRAATACGYVLGAELRACGVDLSFTPVLDLDYPAELPAKGGVASSKSSVIGDRAFAADPRVVTLLAKSLMHGLQLSGMANCGKHFPGHGAVAADSHTDVPVDPRPLKTILAADAQPYSWLGQALTSVMPAHVIYPKVDARPAGFSAKWLGAVLRGQLGFTGAVFSDDLSMAGARMLDGQPVSPTEAAVAALNAGCDMVLLCNQSLDDGSELDALIDGLTEAQLKGQWLASEASEARRRALLPAAPATDWDTLMVQPAYMQALDDMP
ncbi:beta-N-acetylhexosaminidase [Rhodoferax sp.]|uniref:beta-N-acetylhexosaminidase n=2 Tax=Rhodoferax sp. TaxID=50421 RepID=UPI0026158964|nr:beta-N-acetylhexosaminidase [Rhodoferax sp.]MDD5478715.1 beta-N-acetylhexosaminidase [Rhodoferax sp.]